MIQCQIMQDNHVQCPNPAKFTNEGVDYCRLHFSYAIAKAANAGVKSLNPRAIVPEQQAEVELMLKHQEDGVKGTVVNNKFVEKSSEEKESK